MSLAAAVVLETLLAAVPAPVSTPVSAPVSAPARVPTPFPVIPQTPPGMAGCGRTLVPQADLIRRAGETVRYWVQVNGISVGTVDFQIFRNGNFEHQRVTEYRSQFKLDALVATFVPVEGRAAALVPQASRIASRAMVQFVSNALHLEENMTFGGEGRALNIERKRNEVAVDEKRQFAAPVVDFVTAFYWARSLPQDMSGCVIIYGNQRAYTLWVRPDGQESVPTPVGARLADRYRLRYAAEKSRQALEAVFWLATDASRLPYRAEILGPNHVEASVHLYETGKDSGDR
jgi:hypothetical protein